LKISRIETKKVGGGGGWRGVKLGFLGGQKKETNMEDEERERWDQARKN